MSYEFLQPWSTFVMKTKLPLEVVERMIRLTDEIVENRESDSDWISPGQIEEQFYIELNGIESRSKHNIEYGEKEQMLLVVLMQNG